MANQTYDKYKKQIGKIKNALMRYDIETDTLVFNTDTESEKFAHAGIDLARAIKEILNIEDEN